MTTTNEGAERDELLDDILASALANLTDYTDPAVEIADTILSEGYRKPRTITTVEELDALPDEAVVRSYFGTIHQKSVDFQTSREYWASPGDADEYTSGKITLPATLWEPEAESHGVD